MGGGSGSGSGRSTAAASTAGEEEEQSPHEVDTRRPRQAEASGASGTSQSEDEEQRRRRHKQEEAARRRRPLPPTKDLARTFGPMQWLSDASIAFVYSLLEAGEVDLGCGCGGASGSVDRAGPDVAAGEGCDDDTVGLPEAVLLIDPATAFWLTIESDAKDLEAAKRALRLNERELVLCPVTDNRDGGRADAGTHWALLVGWNQSHGGSIRFAFYDSMSGGICGSKNLAQAQTLASRLAGRPVEVSSRACPQQTNTFDCGVYVLLFSEIIIKAFLGARGSGGVQAMGTAGRAAWEESLGKVTPKQVAEHRVSYYKRFSAAAVYAAGGA